jgi:hypothetical protein
MKREIIMYARPGGGIALALTAALALSSCSLASIEQFASDNKELAARAACAAFNSKSGYIQTAIGYFNQHVAAGYIGPATLAAETLAVETIKSNCKRPPVNADGSLNWGGALANVLAAYQTIQDSTVKNAP